MIDLSDPIAAAVVDALAYQLAEEPAARERGNMYAASPNDSDLSQSMGRLQRSKQKELYIIQEEEPGGTEDVWILHY